MKREKETFLRDIGKDLAEENIAIFAGAGMSVGVGFVNWSELLRPIAEELGLDVDKEQDLVALAQYHYNENGNNRSQLNKRLIEEFSRETEVTENHKILSRLPIRTYWTTNYDKLIEQSLAATGKIADVKYTKEQLAFTKPKRDAVVYKMHGDVDHPDQAVLTKDDYERYHVKMDQYLSTLKGDLISKTFIFIGFSFTDPNLDYILSRVRVAFDRNQRRHYCFIRRVIREQDESEADFEYKLRKQELFVKDLNRFNIKAIMIAEYSEITDLLKLVEQQYKRNTIFISGAAHEYGNWNEKESLKFIHGFSSELIAKGYRVVSGFGLGVGGSVITGALEQIYMSSRKNISDQLILRPFPQTTIGNVERAELWRRYREDMISHAGIAIFVFGNKQVDGNIVNSDGMRQEFEIAKQLDVTVIPIGATGFMAKELWVEEMEAIKTNNKFTDEFKKLFSELGDESKNFIEISETLFKLLTLIVKR
ncbi:SIR2 family protein [Methylobacter sp.]|uniref:SIR2 family protein n=1 Tax=Methylobacter sp. TaxID=2051955 RepID=UPI003DA633F8